MIVYVCVLISSLGNGYTWAVHHKRSAHIVPERREDTSGASAEPYKGVNAARSTRLAVANVDTKDYCD